jgi:hypothetical protein
MNPNGTWQTPDDDEGDGVTPVNAIGAYIHVSNQAAASSQAVLFATTKEIADTNPNFFESYCIGGRGEGAVQAVQYLVLGKSRKVRVWGTDTNDNNLHCRLTGYKIRR